MRLRGRTAGWLLALVVITTVAVACGSDGPGEEDRGGSAGQPRQGGTAVIGFLGEPPCADWYAVCGNVAAGGAASGFRIMALQTLPSPMEFIDGRYRPGPMLAGEPIVDPGPPQQVTYRINPRAVWSDGTPITSGDFRYSWEQGRAGNLGGMSDIVAVDDADPATAVVRWREPSASWRDRFRPILPRHLLEEKDRSAEMKDGYVFSGGPWMIDHWTRGQEIKLVRNPRYWGTPANLDAVVFRIVTDSAAFLQAYKTSQVDMILVAGAESGIEELKSSPDTEFAPSTSLGYSNFTFNTARPPLDDRTVRQALAYATDRDAVVKQTQGHLFADARPTQALMSVANSEWYSDPFARYQRDLIKVDALMGGDGWAKGPDGQWAKDGSRAKVALAAAAGVRFQSLIAEIVASQWKDAGFDVTIESVAGATLGGDLVPKGNFQVVFTGAMPNTNEPEHCPRFCSRNIPTEANRFQGTNVSRISSPAIDEVWSRADTELDLTRRHDLVRTGQEVLADELPALPLASFIDVFVFRTTKIGGPVTSTAPFLRLSEWFCPSACG